MVATVMGWVNCQRSSDLPDESRWSGVSQARTSESYGDGILLALLLKPSVKAGARILTDIPVCAAVSPLCCSFGANFPHWSWLLCAGWYQLLICRLPLRP